MSVNDTFCMWVEGIENLICDNQLSINEVYRNLPIKLNNVSYIPEPWTLYVIKIKEIDLFKYYI